MTSILRLTTIHQLSIEDSTYTNVDSAIWTAVECSVAVISACLPTLRPLVRRFLRSQQAIPSPDLESKEFARFHDTSDSSPTRSAQWRSAANEKRICNLDTSEFQRCDDYQRHAHVMPKYMQTQPTGYEYQKDSRVTRNGAGIVLSNGAIVNSTPHLHSWDRP